MINTKFFKFYYTTWGGCSNDGQTSIRWNDHELGDQSCEWSTSKGINQEWSIRWVINLESENRKCWEISKSETKWWSNGRVIKRAINDTDIEHLSDQSRFPLEINWSIDHSRGPLNNFPMLYNKIKKFNVDYMVSILWVMCIYISYRLSQN